MPEQRARTYHRGRVASTFGEEITAMPEAALLYQSMGFAEIPRFNDNSVPGVRFYRLGLRD